MDHNMLTVYFTDKPTSGQSTSGTSEFGDMFDAIFGVYIIAV